MVKDISRKGDFTEGKILKKLIFFAIPMAIAALVQQLFNTADVAIVGQFGGSAYQAAVGATSSTISLIVNFFLGFSIAVNVVMANAQGAKDEERKLRTVHTGIALSFVGGVIVLLIGLFTSKFILQLIKTPEDIIEYAALYLKIYFIGVPAQLIYNFAAASLRAVGESKRPLYYLSIAGIVNVIINFITVAIFKWHVVGVALGTVFANYLSAIWVLFDLKAGKRGISFSFRKVCFHKKELNSILKIGFPLGLSSCITAIAMLLIQSNANAFGPAAIAGKTIASNLEDITATFSNAISNGVVTFVAQNIGAKKEKRVHRIIGIGLASVAVWLTFTAIILIVFGKYICGIYNTDPEVISFAMRRIYIMEIWYVVICFSCAYGGALRGMGHTLFTTLTNLICITGMTIIYSSFIYPLLPQTFELVYIIYPIIWLLAGLVQMAGFYIIASKKGYFKKEKSLSIENEQTI